MTQLVINIPNNKASEIKRYLKANGVIIEPDKAALKNGATKKQVLSGLETGLKQAKLMAEGKLKGGSLDDLINGK